MRRQYRHLWPAVTSFANLLLAFRKAARGKRSRAGAAGFEFKLEENLVALRRELLDGSYQPGGYTSFVVHDPKRRLISAAPFRDRVVHHALMNVTAPLFERSFIDDSFANRAGKGTHRALDRCTTYLRRYRYLLPLDVRQFFPSIDHAILAANLQRTLGDAKALHLCRQILASGAGILADEYEMVYFPGDDLFAVSRPRGLPIGNLTSQFWANVYLNPFDHFVKRQLQVPGYVRYVDDMLLFGDSKAELQAVRQSAIEYLAGLRLTVHENSAQVRPSATGIPFLGFQLFPDHRRLKRRKGVQAVRRFKGLVRQHRAGRLSQTRIKASVIGWINHVRYGDTWGLRQKRTLSPGAPAGREYIPVPRYVDAGNAHTVAPSPAAGGRPGTGSAAAVCALEPRPRAAAMPAPPLDTILPPHVQVGARSPGLLQIGGTRLH